MGFFIDDGCTAKGKITKRPPLWTEDLEFTFRPPTLVEKDAFRVKNGQAVDAKAKSEVLANFVVNHLTGWNAGEEITVGSIKRMHDSLVVALFNMISSDGAEATLITEGN